MDVLTIEDTLQDLGVDSTYDVLPFGALSVETLTAAEKVLKDIGDVIAEKDNLRQNAKSQDKFAELMHKIVNLSEEFYQLLPVYGYQYEKLCPLFSEPDVHSKLKLINNLLHIGLSSQLFLGASLKSAGKSQKSDRQNVEVQSIYAVHIPETVRAFKLKLSNHSFCGWNTSNMLSSCLRIEVSPLECKMNCYLLERYVLSLWYHFLEI
ncbi:hypothetical protein AVEN_123606-1 [Araneus ventricosus]|uniref:PARP alpha-helical domain-containing protein n=1 Tax=Araneus ventricosus TaxID=182803 RepID=A0A4Y2W8H2_ARAVE|nr:hypothetical protein AVEN_123606-1 [Araneus ventricosus]